MLTPEDIAAIRERAEKATAGPWETLADEGEYDFWGSVKGPDYGVCHDVQIGYDALFIANARQDIPALLAHVEELEAKPSTERRFWKDGDKLYVEQYVRIGDCSDLNDPKRTEGELRAKLNKAMDNTISLLP